MPAMLASAVPAGDCAALSRQRLRWKLLGLIETDVQSFANSLGTDLATQIRSLWKYPYLNVTLDVNPEDATAMRDVASLDAFLVRYTVSRDDISASDMVGGMTAANWEADDEELQDVLRVLPSGENGPRYVVETTPPLSHVLKSRDFSGSLEIRCTAPSGKVASIRVPLRGPEVRDYIKEYSAWFYVTDVETKETVQTLCGNPPRSEANHHA
jgi:hypothetical protein